MHKSAAAFIQNCFKIYSIKNHFREKSRLLGLHSPTNNSNKEFAPKEVSIVGEAKAGDLSQNNDKKEKMKTDDGRDASTSAVMGLSYQQAAGHSSPQPSSKENKNADDISISKKSVIMFSFTVLLNATGFSLSDNSVNANNL